MLRFAAVIFTVASLTSSSVLGCTTFCLKNNGENMFGKNYDWNVSAGVIFVNKRGVGKMSAVESESNIAKWTSKYGSVTFNQYGWESPSGGMNEAGLAIELMWLDGSKYPGDQRLPALDVLEWIQYQLDVSATTAEVIKNSENVRIVSAVPLHYLVNDQAGNTATIEFLDGKLVAHTGDKLPVATLTNDTYTRSVAYAADKDPAAARGPGSLERFARASARTKSYTGKTLGEKESVGYAFDILTDAAQGNYTQWSIVYDQKRHKIHYRTRTNPSIRTIDARSFDYSCASPVMVFDIDSGSAGDVTRSFAAYTRAVNRDLIERSFNGTDFLKSVSAKARDGFTDFPGQFTCNGPAPAKGKRQTAAAGSIALLDIVFPAYYVYKQLLRS